MPCAFAPREAECFCQRQSEKPGRVNWIIRGRDAEAERWRREKSPEIGLADEVSRFERFFFPPNAGIKGN